MEKSPLTLAHNHARNALLESRRANPVAASEEHDLAAVEFATAAQGTSDAEAVRILHLLEQHHKKLGQILKFRHEHPQPYQAESRTSSTQPSVNPSTFPSNDQPPAVTPPPRTASPESPQHPPRLSQKSRATARDLSSSIASNLATARGIPGSHQRRGPPVSPTLSAQHVGAKFGREQSKPHSTLETGSVVDNKEVDDRPARPSWTPPADPSIAGAHHANQEQNTEDARPTSYDAPFQHFYNTFESLVSKISAPLAFAGLPLTIAQSSSPTTAETQSQPSSKTNPKKTSKPIANVTEAIDYSQLISRAALRAVRDGGSNPAAESFYVVPTTGGTVSYADIMSRDERHRRHLPNISEDSNNDDFVDARETIPDVNMLAQENTASSRGKIPRLGKAAASAASLSKDTITVGGKTMEELALENQALKHLSDTLSKRLHVFEVSAQSSSAALAQSIRSLQRSPLVTPENSAKRRQDSASGHNHSQHNKRSDLATEAAQARIAELEEILKKSDKELARRDKENAKLKDVVVRYREKWEKLKEGARARREGGGGGDKGTPKKEKAEEDPMLGIVGQQDGPPV